MGPSFRWDDIRWVGQESSQLASPAQPTVKRSIYCARSGIAGVTPFIMSTSTW